MIEIEATGITRDLIGMIETVVIVREIGIVIGIEIVTETEIVTERGMNGLENGKESVIGTALGVRDQLTVLIADLQGEM